MNAYNPNIASYCVIDGHGRLIVIDYVIDYDDTSWCMWQV